MKEIAQQRHRRMVKQIAMARAFGKNAALFQGAGANYRKDRNPGVASLARELMDDGAQVRIYAMRALVVLWLGMWLRVYSWPWRSGGISADRKFWAGRLIPAYRTLEGKILQLAQSAEPSYYDLLLRKTTLWSKETTAQVEGHS